MAEVIERSPYARRIRVEGTLNNYITYVHTCPSCGERVGNEPGLTKLPWHLLHEHEPEDFPPTEMPEPVRRSWESTAGRHARSRP